jgi:hypothetical protein
VCGIPECGVLPDFQLCIIFIVTCLLDWHATSSSICIDGGEIVDGKGHSSEE